MKILLTGAHGQLGKELYRKLRPYHSVFALGKEDLDITNKNEVEKRFSQIKPELILHAAAFTAVDKCEIERMKAFEVNGLGAGTVAIEASKIGAKMLYYSSDYVFDGNKKTPYQEDDKPNPQSIYGMSKLLGEQFVLNFNKGIIIRTSWLYGHDGKNFVKTMLKLAEDKKEVRVVDDQIGTPTYVPDLADLTIQLMDRGSSGIYHISNNGSCTWYEFAKAIFSEAGHNQELVKATSTEEFGSLAPRPHYSILGHNALINAKIKPLRPWEEALKEFIRKEISQ
ncbi:dTDP-4-dehydrorhamnose reductase [Metabacillus arenae]|uniref:dTDP-4-dehydrorhamnose reductase n=1 Tax=Metabacillus arenae TaxID=2771434 RepID=A0A926RUV9_9BACI|nr:dTDP-4-dehydrorhamnose reductase [Metabacillus arenae]MBD1378993.1 dTDP-4-dehydrorhamnose reductase [Metabacillus arenae]